MYLKSIKRRNPYKNDIIKFRWMVDTKSRMIIRSLL